MKNIKINFLQKVVLIFVVIIIVSSLILSIKLEEKFDQVPTCNRMDSVNTSVKVRITERTLIGFNLNKDNLSFGTVSPGANVKRSIYANYSKDAKAKIVVEGDIKPWISISSPEFEIKANVTKTIEFTANIPETAIARNYNGKIIFCYIDK